jgi:ubiquinone/menaquinone biosynthesis C-methylase UbiE
MHRANAIALMPCLCYIKIEFILSKEKEDAMKKKNEILDFYTNKYNENERMMRQPLEFLRCKEIIARYLTAEKMEIADIGGATGVFSYWLAAQNHKVHLLDYTQAHIDRAKENGKLQNLSLESYTCGDARALPYADNAFDIVLEMGPLYHLQEGDDRIKCLEEAWRVLKSGGVMLCEVISRYANLFECFQDDLLNNETFVALLEENLRSGKHTPGDSGFFTTAFFHTPNLITEELTHAGFTDIKLIAVEGFAQILDINDFMYDENRKAFLLEYIRRTESIPELLGVSGHYIAIAKKADTTT